MNSRSVSVAAVLMAFALAAFGCTRNREAVSQGAPQVSVVHPQRGEMALPRVVAMRSASSYCGDDWIGLKMRDASVVRGIGVLPIFTGLLGMLLLLGSLALTWAREGR